MVIRPSIFLHVCLWLSLLLSVLQVSTEPLCPKTAIQREGMKEHIVVRRKEARRVYKDVSKDLKRLAEDDGGIKHAYGFLISAARNEDSTSYYLKVLYSDIQENIGFCCAKVNAEPVVVKNKSDDDGDPPKGETKPVETKKHSIESYTCTL